jgi:hypothetical protein
MICGMKQRLRVVRYKDLNLCKVGNACYPLAQKSTSCLDEIASKGLPKF